MTVRSIEHSPIHCQQTFCLFCSRLSVNREAWIYWCREVAKGDLGRTCHSLEWTCQFCLLAFPNRKIVCQNTPEHFNFETKIFLGGTHPFARPILVGRGKPHPPCGSSALVLDCVHPTVLGRETPPWNCVYPAYSHRCTVKRNSDSVNWERSSLLRKMSDVYGERLTQNVRRVIYNATDNNDIKNILAKLTQNS